MSATGTDNIPEPFLSDRAILVAIFGAVACLARELTGKELICTVDGPFGLLQIHGDCHVSLVRVAVSVPEEPPSVPG